METQLAGEEIALHVDAFVLDDRHQLPGEMREHAEWCFECKLEGMGGMELAEAP